MNKKAIFAEHEGEYYVKAKYSGIHPLVMLVDGLPITFFGKGKTQYLRVKTVIEWHEKEIADSKGKSGDRRVVDALKKALEQFKQEEGTDATE